ncbi:MAG: magnesium/cobalt transporter CorA [Oligoflexia bacterium]|nr:magnesium/cobalt transporter CorA [Oligoflexia bacterium]
MTYNIFKISDDGCHEYQLDDIRRINPGESLSTTYWIQVHSLHNAGEIELMGSHFGINNLLLEDILNTEHLPKLEEIDDSILAILKNISFDAGNMETKTEHVALLKKNNIILTFSESPSDIFRQVKYRITCARGKKRKSSPDYLYYILLDSIIDTYFIFLNDMETMIEETDEKLVSNPAPEIGNRITDVYKSIISIKRRIKPLKNIPKLIRTGEFDFITEHTSIYFMDLADHIEHIIEELDSFEHYVSNIQQRYMAMLGHKTNEIMKTLTIFASIFIPLTFLAGVYGMNFKHFPELEWKAGYPLFWIISVSLIIIMLTYFKFKKWK